MKHKFYGGYETGCGLNLADVMQPVEGDANIYSADRGCDIFGSAWARSQVSADSNAPTFPPLGMQSTVMTKDGSYDQIAQELGDPTYAAAIAAANPGGSGQPGEII